jgi:hypothetical protein
MQEEVTKHTRKIYRVWKQSKHSATDKIKEILIEIFIIVFAVSLSIWFHGWSDHRHEQQEVTEFLKGLRNDLTEDIKLVENNKAAVATLHSNFRFLYGLEKKDTANNKINDTTIYKSLSFDFRITRPNIGRYEGFKSSGKIGTIENNTLKENILVFYEQSIPDLVYGEHFVNDVQSKMLDLEIENNDIIPIRDLATSARMKSMLNIGMQNFESNMRKYDEVINHAKKIIGEIDKETR